MSELSTSYFQLSLSTHPDKNPDDPNATQQFQKISEAYRVLLKHLDNNNDPDESNYDDDYVDEESLYDFYRCSSQAASKLLELLRHLSFSVFRHLFEMVMRGEEHTFYARTHIYKSQKEEESPEQHRTRIRRHLDEQKAGEERRRKERLQLKARREFEREQERCEAEERQKTKNSDKKAAAKAQRQKDIETMRKRLEVSQKLRSAIFAAARKGNGERVKQGIWEEDVDAAGGEVKDGCHDFVEIVPADPYETLLHIAARCGDHNVVKWLDGHGAEPEERDSAGLTAFHVALQCGNIPIVTYFFEEHPPTADTAKIYDLPSSTSLLSLAFESLQPELVWMILDKKLANKETMTSVWGRLVDESENLARKAPTKCLPEKTKQTGSVLAHQIK
ncbi:hypothetical protein C0992_001370 [Termitomyces sp. T32_za158]|nr:hypothetical protein C0992_001370 [Termitomyces sp. T32_za158]